MRRLVLTTMLVLVASATIASSEEYKAETYTFANSEDAEWRIMLTVSSIVVDGKRLTTARVLLSDGTDFQDAGVIFKADSAPLALRVGDMMVWFEPHKLEQPSLSNVHTIDLQVDQETGVSIPLARMKS